MLATMSDATPDTDAWEAVLRLHAALLPILESEVRAATGLSLSRYDVLLELNRAPEHRLRLSELGERVVLSRTRVSRLVDAMEGEGLIAKAPDPSDGRATFASMTRRGRSMLRRAAPVYVDGIRRHFADRLTRTEHVTITTSLRRVLQSIEAEHAT